MSELKFVQHLIGSESVESSDGATFETRNPHDNGLLGTVARGTAKDGERAIEVAREAFDSGAWPRMSPKERAKILHAVADAVDAHVDELAELECRDAGKNIGHLSHAEIPRVAHNFRFFADYAALAANDAYPDGDLLSYVLYPPSTIAAISSAASSVIRPSIAHPHKTLSTGHLPTSHCSPGDGLRPSARAARRYGHRRRNPAGYFN